VKTCIEGGFNKLNARSESNPLSTEKEIKVNKAKWITRNFTLLVTLGALEAFFFVVVFFFLNNQVHNQPTVFAYTIWTKPIILGNRLQFKRKVFTILM